MAKTKTAVQPSKLPTFAECSLEFWADDEAGGLWVPPVSSIKGELLNDIVEFISLYDKWWLIQHDPDEADARKDYASHAARYLTGIFPNARVNVEAYGEAAGEELGRYSADIVKLVATRARRSSKTLPSVAQLVEWAVAEAKQREKQHHALQTVMRDYNAAIKRGEEQGRAMIEKAGLSDRLTLERLGNFHRGLTGDSLGIQPPPPIVYGCGRSMICYVTKMTALYRLIGQGHEGSAAWLVEASNESHRLHAQVDAAGQWETHPNAWHEFISQCRSDLMALLNAEAEKARQPPSPTAQPPGTPIPLSALRRGIHVSHGKFGVGTVIAVDEDKIEVVFDTSGVKRVLARFLSLASPKASTTTEVSE